jgi:hypothetical protein
MVEHLTAFDMERRNTPVTATSDPGKTTPYRQHSDKGPKQLPTRTAGETSDQSRSQITVSRTTPFRPSPSMPRVPSRTPPASQPPQSSGSCYNCRKTGHFSKDCPIPQVREIKMEVEEQEQEQEFVDATDSLPDQDRSGNGEA